MKKRRSIIFRIAVFAFIVYIGVNLVNLQIQINSKKNELADLSSQYRAQQTQNEQTQRLLATNNNDQFTENVARDKLNYAKPGERIFINVPGN